MLVAEGYSWRDISDMYSEEGATGLGLYVALNLYLSHCEGGRGIYISKKLTAIAPLPRIPLICVRKK